MWPTSDDLLTRSIYDSGDDVEMAARMEEAGYTVHPNVGLKPEDTAIDIGLNEEPTATYACLCYDFIVEAVLMGTLCLFGFAGNTVATVCLRNDKSKTATPFLLVSLEVADTLFLVAVFGLRVLTSIDTFSGPLPGLHVAYPFLGRVVYPWALAAETGTIYLTVLVTVNRYISVCWPYRVSDWCSVRCARRHVAAVAAFSIVFNLPRFFEYEYGPEPSAPSVANNSAGFESQLTTLSSGAIVFQHLMTTDSSTDLQMSAAEVMMADGVNKSPSARGTPSEDAADVQLALQPSALSEHPLYRLIYSNVLYFIVMFFIPLVSLTFLNQRLIVALRQTQKKRQSLLRGSTSNAGVSGRNPSRSTTSNSAGRDGDSGGSSSRSEEDITFMLIVVVMVFVLTQAPAAVTQAFESRLDEKSKACPSPYFYYVRISDLLVVANSSLNFVIYCLCSRRFRHILMTVVCRCPCLANSASPGYDLGNRSVVNGASRRAPQPLPTPVTRPPEHQPLAASPASPDDGLVTTMSSSRSTQRERRGTMESVTTRGDVTTADQTENLMNDTGSNDPDDVISSV